MECSLTTPETDRAYRFDNGAAYESFMGRWSGGAGKVFLDWIVPKPGACWLDVGCGTGTLTELIVDMCSPASVSAIDPEQAQILHAQKGPAANRARFEIGDAGVLPFADGTFDIVASGLVLNFIPDMARALSEMRRVARSGGTIGGYVWDFAAERSPTWPLRLGLRELGAFVGSPPGADNSTLTGLSTLFKRAGLEGIATSSIEVTTRFPDFDNFGRRKPQASTPLLS
jgi:SAM-dependent methyltransferase